MGVPETRSRRGYGNGERGAEYCCCGTLIPRRRPCACNGTSCNELQRLHRQQRASVANGGDIRHGKKGKHSSTWRFQRSQCPTGTKSQSICRPGAEVGMQASISRHRQPEEQTEKGRRKRRVTREIPAASPSLRVIQGHPESSVAYRPTSGPRNARCIVPPTIIVPKVCAQDRRGRHRKRRQTLDSSTT